MKQNVHLSVFSYSELSDRRAFFNTVNLDRFGKFLRFPVQKTVENIAFLIE